MAALKNPKAEEDAQRIAKMWMKRGKNAATKIYKQVVARENLTGAECVMLSGRVHEIVKEKTNGMVMESYRRSV